MRPTLNNPVVRVWMGLVLVTVISWGIGTEHGFSHGIGPNLAIPAVLTIAFLKGHFVGSFFMELRTAPLPLRLAFSGWIVGVGAIVIAMYLWA